MITLTRILSKPLIIMITITIWRAVYNHLNNTIINGLTLDETINYMMFNLIIGSLSYTQVSERLGMDIRNGYLIIKLLKPAKYSLIELSRELGDKLHKLIFESIPGIIIAILLFEFHYYSIITTITSLISITLGLIINFFISLIWGLLYFKNMEYRPLEEIKNKIIIFLSGYLIPLNFLPQTIMRLSSALPFKFITYVPARIFINSYNNTEIMMLLLTQIVWVIVLYTLYKIGWHQSLKSFNGARV